MSTPLPSIPADDKVLNEQIARALAASAARRGVSGKPMQKSACLVGHEKLSDNEIAQRLREARAARTPVPAVQPFSKAERRRLNAREKKQEQSRLAEKEKQERAAALSRKPFRITRDWIFEHRTNTGGWTRRQISALGLKWPTRTGWIDRLVGTMISQKSQRSFEGGKHLHAAKAPVNALPYDEDGPCFDTGAYWPHQGHPGYHRTDDGGEHVNMADVAWVRAICA